MESERSGLTWFGWVWVLRLGFWEGFGEDVCMYVHTYEFLVIYFDVVVRYGISIVQDYTI